jgi:hypothetical protein
MLLTNKRYNMNKIDEIQVNKTQSIIENYLNEKQILFSTNEEDDKKVIQVGFNMEIGIVNTYFVIQSSIKIVEVFTYLPLRVPDEKKLEVSKFLDMIEQTYFMGSLQLNHEDGQIRTKSYFIYGQNEISNTLIDMHYNATFHIANSSYSEIMKICYGNHNAESIFSESINKININNN